MLSSTRFVIPLTALPASIVIIKEGYSGSFFVIHPLKKPYVSSSRHIAIPVGISGGIPVNALDSNGVSTPIKAPYAEPHTKPHSNTGICIGRKTAPACGPKE